MQQSFSIFLLVAEEMSISRAAKRAFVTQQCASDHIRRLEREYGVALFERKPRFRLTMAGEAMLQTLRSISVLENNMESDIKKMSAGQKGNFTLGISTSRAPTVLPRVLKRYFAVFPDVNISFYVNDTVILEQCLLEGKIDLFLGVNTSQNPTFSAMPLADDEMRLIISSQLLRQHFGSKIIREFERGADLSAFSEVPFSLYYKTGALNIIINQHLKEYRLRLKTSFHISDCDTHIMLCALGLCAAICPKMLLSRVHEHNANCSPDEIIFVFPIKNFTHTLRLDLVWNKHITQPFFIRTFMEIMREEVDAIACES